MYACVHVCARLVCVDAFVCPVVCPDGHSRACARAWVCICCLLFVLLYVPYQHDYHRNGLGPTTVRLAQQASKVGRDVRCGHRDDDKQQVRTPCRGRAVPMRLFLGVFFSLGTVALACLAMETTTGSQAVPSTRRRRLVSTTSHPVRPSPTRSCGGRRSSLTSSDP